MIRNWRPYTPGAGPAHLYTNGALKNIPVKTQKIRKIVCWLLLHIPKAPFQTVNAYNSI
jgi:hypothetical protein